MTRRALFLFTALAGLACAQEAAPAALYRDQIKPLLQKSCVMCHGSGPVKQAGLDLTTRESLLKGGDNGPVVVPGNPDASRLYKLVAHLEEPGMPYKGKKLPGEVIAAIAAWIKAGVPYDAAPSSVTAAPKPPDHWAFRSPRRPPVPAVKAKGWVRNPIDAFIAAEHEKRGLKPLPEAGRRTLLRRVYLDLIGLPPTAEEMRDFLADRSPDAYEKVVDKLLASPRHGERWGRHWLDIWRYSDWYGWRKQNQVRYSQRHIWRWRDWTIESLNASKGYDRMILEMLAGDEIAPADPQVTRATGYLARNWYMFNRNVWLQDTVEYTAAGFLGLTMKCARCHSHKYDPITHLDYYRFRAFFEPHELRTDRVPGEPDTVKAGLARAYDADAAAPTYRFLRGNENTPDKDNPLSPAVPEFLQKAKLEIRPVELPFETWYPDARPFVERDVLAQAKAEIEKADAALKKAREEYAKVSAPPLDASATWVTDHSAEIRKAQEALTASEKKLAAAQAALPALQARIAAENAKYAHPPSPDAEKLADEARKAERQASIKKAEHELFLANIAFEQAKGNDEKKLAEAKKRLDEAAAALGAAKESYTPLGKVYPSTSTGRRLALARWMASRDNPLTARVAINHMWLRHFGKALVPTVFNFGKSGKPPSHPELLDWLATEFMARNWDMKAIHRLMVTSSAYRMKSSGWASDDPNVAKDPDNLFLWRMNARRMEAEAVRDSLLQLAGKLDTTMGGPEIEETKGQEVLRRSVYFRHAPDLQMEMLKVFDLASPNECFERSESIVPQQALALTNSSLSFSMARVIAGRLSSQAQGRAFIRSAFELILGRPPSPAEAAESASYLVEQAALYRDPAKLTTFRTGEAALVKPSSDPDQRARESLVHVLLNHNDFVTIR